MNYPPVEQLDRYQQTSMKRTVLMCPTQCQSHRCSDSLLARMRADLRSHDRSRKAIRLSAAAFAFGLMPQAAHAAASVPAAVAGIDLTLLIRIAIAALLAFAIGWEREFRGSEAGDRTFTLVGLGAAAFTAVGVENFPATAEKVMAGVVTGVGFLGGGMILRDGGAVRGLTTAAAMWATAAVGMLAGVGELMIGALVAGLVIIVLELQFIPVIRRFDARRLRTKRTKQEETDHPS